MSTYDDDDDTVGYRRPPKATRFAKGRSGNPSGRPKRTVTGMNSFEEMLARLVPVTMNGVTKRIPLKEALEMKVVEGCATLAPQQLLRMLKELEREVERNREVEARLNAQRTSSLVSECIDCKEIVDALIAVGLVSHEDGVRQVVPEMLYKLISRKEVELDERPEIVTLKRHYWPGTTPLRPSEAA